MRDLLWSTAHRPSRILVQKQPVVIQQYVLWQAVRTPSFKQVQRDGYIQWTCNKGQHVCFELQSYIHVSGVWCCSWDSWSYRTLWICLLLYYCLLFIYYVGTESWQALEPILYDMPTHLYQWITWRTFYIHPLLDIFIWHGSCLLKVGWLLACTGWKKISSLDEKTCDGDGPEYSLRMEDWEAEWRPLMLWSLGVFPTTHWLTNVKAVKLDTTFIHRSYF